DAFRAGHLPGARNLPRGELELRADRELPDPTARILTYCQLGKISTLAAHTLRTMGYARAVALDAASTPGSRPGTRWRPRRPRRPPAAERSRAGRSPRRRRADHRQQRRRRRRSRWRGLRGRDGRRRRRAPGLAGALVERDRIGP